VSIATSGVPLQPVDSVRGAFALKAFFNLCSGQSIVKWSLKIFCRPLRLSVLLDRDAAPFFE